MTLSEHFWKFRCRKSARHCGTKHVSKSKVLKSDGLGALLEVQMSKKCTPLWREAHFEVKSVKNRRSPATFGRSDVVSHGRRKGLCTLPEVSKTCGFCSSTTLQLPLHYIHYSPLHYNYNYIYNYIALRYTTLHSITLNYATLRYTTLHHTTLHYTTVHHSTRHHTTLHYITLTTTTATTTTTLLYTTLH